jgi:hypothetical protein
VMFWRPRRGVGQLTHASSGPKLNRCAPVCRADSFRAPATFHRSWFGTQIRWRRSPVLRPVDRLSHKLPGAMSVQYNPLLTALPAVIHLSASGPKAAPGWLGALLPIAAGETGRTRAGGENVLSRLSELIFVEAIRRYIETLPPSQTAG